MEGLYLYCIRERLEPPFPFSAKGIDERQEVFTIACHELEAVVSKVSLKEFDSETIQIKAREDLNWIKEKVVIHEKVIEEAMRRDDNILSLIPMRFGTIFKEKARLEESLNKDYSKIKEVLDRIRGKQEWGVKVYLADRERVERVVKEKNEAIKGKEREVASLPEGMAYFMEEELREVISREVDNELNNMAEAFFKGLKKKAVASVKNKILGKELTGKREPMILNAAYLISEEKIEGFKKKASDLNQRMQDQGCYLEFSGPWPAYNFSHYSATKAQK
ncbi:MAG: GvpL/GvpF family gas vesicle protein [bacterium]